MMMKPRLWIFLYAFLYASFSLAQFDDSKKIKSLEEKIVDNNDLMMVNPDQAFAEIDVLMAEALKDRNRDLEMNLMSRKTWYYVRKSEYDKAIESVQEMDAKAIEYADNFWQATAHQHLIEIYASSDLPEKAISEFEKSMKLFDDSDVSEEKLNYSKALNHIKIANVYEQQKDFKKLIHTLLESDKYINRLKKEKVRSNFLYINYSNLGVAYSQIGNFDSTIYFINKSLTLAPNKQNHLIQFRNYLALGQAFNENQKYAEAINYLRKADLVEPLLATSIFERETLYSNLVKGYEGLGNKDSLHFYTQKWKDLQIELEKSKNKSLHKIIDKNLLKEKSYTTHIFIGSGVLLFILIVLLIRSYKINKTLKKQEVISQEYLNKLKEEPEVEDDAYARLIELARQNDQSFLVNFHKYFPNFTQRILTINPNMAQTEIEFMALIRLNLSTKEISQIQNIQPKTVQNKKRRIRQRLNIPSEIDIYYFFNQF